MCIALAGTRVAALQLGAVPASGHLAAFALLAGLALGAVRSGRPRLGAESEPRPVGWALAWAALAAALVIVLVAVGLSRLPFVLAAISGLFSASPTAWLPWVALASTCIGAPLFAAGVAPGTLLAQLFDGQATRCGPLDPGRRVAVWAAGSAAAPLILASGLFAAVGPLALLLVAAGLFLIAAMILPPRPRLFRVAAVAAVALLPIVWSLFAPLDPAILYQGLARSAGAAAAPPFAAFATSREGEWSRTEGLDGSVTLVGGPRGGAVRLDGAIIADRRTAVSEVALGHLGFLFQPAARRVLVLGAASGRTARAAAAHAEARVTVADRSSLLARAFLSAGSAAAPPPAGGGPQAVVADTAAVLATSPPSAFDIIVWQPRPLTVDGRSDAPTLERYLGIARLLAAEGVLVQRVDLSELDEDLLTDVLCTAHHALPFVSIFRLGAGEVAVVASRTKLVVDESAVALAFSSPAVVAELASHRQRSLPLSLDELLLTQVASSARLARLCQAYDQPMSIWRAPLASRASRARFSGRWPRLLLADLDERLTAGGSLFLRSRLLRRPLDGPSRTALYHFLLARGLADEEPLLAVAAPADARPAAVALVLAGLPSPTRVSWRRRSAICRALRATGDWLIDIEETVLGRLDGPPVLLGWQALCQPGILAADAAGAEPLGAPQQASPTAYDRPTDGPSPAVWLAAPASLAAPSIGVLGH